MSVREQILAAPELEPLSVPEWGCTVYLPVVSLAEADDMPTKEKLGDGWLAHFLVFAVRDKDGNKEFTTEDAEALSKKSATAAKRIIEAFSKLNNLDDPAKN